MIVLKDNILFKDIKLFSKKKLLLILLILFTTIVIVTTYAVFSYEVNSNNTIKLTAKTEVQINFVQNFGYTGNFQEFTVPYTGFYKIELWGAQGGDGGAGGYSTGTIKLTAGEKLYFYVGFKPTVNATECHDSINNSSFNGSAIGSCRGGGGATDVRLVSGAWNNINSLISRIMVAGGGGGRYYAGHGGVGGGLIGGTSNHNTAGGTQITGGGFGNGSKGTAIGGGGYYGGVGASAVNAGGGSSFISGYAGVNAVANNTTITHTDNTLHYSGKYFITGNMTQGVNSANGSARITYVMSKLPKTNTNLNNVRYIKSCSNGNNVNVGGHWVEIQAIKDGVNIALNKTVTGTGAFDSGYPYTRIVDGNITSSVFSANMTAGLKCVTVDLGATYDLDEIAIWGYYADGRKNYDNTFSVGATDASGTTMLSTVLHNHPGTTGYNETQLGKRYTAWD